MLKKSILWVLLPLLTALLTIFYQFNQLPKFLTHDEIEFARFAMDLSTKAYTPYSSYATGHATPYFYILLGSFKLFGLSAWALRLPAAVFGVLTVGAVYFLMSLVFQNGAVRVGFPGLKRSLEIPTACILAIMLATSRWYINFARYSFEATFILFLEVVSLTGMLLFIRSRKVSWLIVSATFAGLAYNSYQPGRIFFIIPLLLLLLSPKIRNFKSVLIYAVIAGLCMLPLGIYFSYHNDVRITQQLYFADPNLSTSQKAEFLATNIIRTTGMFLWKGDVSGRHNYPLKVALNPIMLGLVVLGFGASLRKFKRPMCTVFLAYAALAMIPTLMTYPHENPNMLRTITVLPSLLFFAGMGLAVLYDRGSKIDKKHFIQPWVGLLVIVLVIISSAQDMHTYFIFQREVFKQAFEVQDDFAGVYTFMKERNIPISGFHLTAAEMAHYSKVTK